MLERIKDAAAGEIAAVASYDIDRLHRNDLEFFRFMAEMAEHRILVFDSSGLVSAVDQLPWKVKAIVAQEERVKVARRVRDNLRYLKRTGHLLGVIPQGYRRVDGAVIEDPEVAPVIRQTCELYGTGRFSLQTLADHLNSLGIRPKRGPGKTKHNRPAAVIFTGDVLKDLFDNPSDIGKLRVDGQLIEAKHPALIDEATWNRCLEVRRRNRRNTSNNVDAAQLPADAGAALRALRQHYARRDLQQQQTYSRVLRLPRGAPQSLGNDASRPEVRCALDSGQPSRHCDSRRTGALRPQ